MFLLYSISMLKMLAIIVLALGVIDFARPQVPRDGSQKNQTSQPSHSKGKAQSEASLGNVEIQQTPAEQKQETTAKPQGYQWRELIAPANVPNWVLAGVGICGILAAICTLRSINKQADLMGKQLKEMARQNTTIIKSERAWILVKRLLPPKDLLPPNPKTASTLEVEALNLLNNDPNYLNSDAATQAKLLIAKKAEIGMQNSALVGFWVMTIGFKFKVYGNTPAKITEFALVFRVVNGKTNGSKTEPDLIEPPEYGTPSKSEEVPDMGSVLAPKFTFTAGIPLQNGKLEPDEVADIIHHKKFLCAYGFVRYRDSFEGTPIRETRFCYVYDVRNGGVYIDPETSRHISPDAFRVGGPDSYNQAT